MMVDVPLLATWLAFFNFLLCGADSPRQNRRYAYAALACAAALLIKYSSLVLLVILCLSLLAERRRAQIWTILIPLAALAAWSAFNVFDYGSIHIATRSDEQHHARLWLPEEAVAWILAFGALTPLGLVAAVQSRGAAGRSQAVLYGGALLAFAVVVLSVASGLLSDTAADKLLWLCFLANGTLICLALIPDALGVAYRRFWQRVIARVAAPELYLMLWLLGTTAFYVLFAPFIAARHVLLVLPPLTLLLVAHCGPSLTRESRVFGLAFMVIVSAGLCLSDWRFADFYQREAAKLAQSLPKAGRVWVSGHWGWQWYAERKGFREIDTRLPDLRPGDYLVVPSEVHHETLPAPPPMRLVRTDAQDQPLLNLFCTGREGRFYLSDYRTAPWSLSRDCLNHVMVFQVEEAGPAG